MGLFNSSAPFTCEPAPCLVPACRALTSRWTTSWRCQAPSASRTVQERPACVGKCKTTLRWFVRGLFSYAAVGCEYLGQRGPVARTPALSCRTARHIACGARCIEIPTLTTHRLPCSPYAFLSAMPKVAGFTPHGAAVRRFSHGGRPYFALLIPG